ncbi:MAG TPA: LPS assembly protein LptD, partial [Burkholderiales bacterium]|nr:LPS assembly protein LptD [Burkholderiales bacterium]
MPRPKPVFLSLLCLFSSCAFADGGAPLEFSQELLPASGKEELPIYIRADKMGGHQGVDFEATGHAEFRKRDQSIVADWIKYLQASDEVEAKGHVRIEQNGSVVEGPELQLRIKDNIGYMEEPVYRFQGGAARGHASLLEFKGKDKYSLHKAVYTTCPVGNDDWFLRVGELDLDQAEQVGIAHDASITFKGTPILYTPWLDFPTGNRRRSGFLAPIFGSTASGGEEITVPYYWNIAPNMDATIAPRLLVKRGAMLNTEFRYLEPNYSGEMHVNVLPNDQITKTTRDEMDLQHNQNFGGGWSGELNLQRVSDSYYYLDLSPLVTMTSQTVLPREGHLTYNGGWWNFTSRVQNYQTLSNPFVPVVAPYAALPQFLLGGEKENLGGLDATFNGEYDDFRHPIFVNGKRLVVNPTVSYPISNSAAFFTPKIGLHAASYSLGANNITSLPNSSIEIPYASVDSGLYFDRNMTEKGLVQTLEPRIYYVYVPYRDQNNLP